MPRKSSAPASERVLTIYVVSDATGETAERMIRSALVQFKNAPAEVIRRGRIRTAKQVRSVVRDAADSHSLIIHTLVSPELRRVMLSETHLHDVDVMDLMGPLLDRLGTHLKLKPQQKPGLFKQIVAEKSREIEAVDFAFRHDDGQRADELDLAEVVLVGVSRTMKTPTMLYLAYRGWFAANVPIVPDIDPPPALLKLPAQRVFCLIMTASRLYELRSVRVEHLGAPLESYVKLADIRRELLHARELSHANGWRQIDVTAKSVEEAAREIITWLAEAGDKRAAAW